MILFAIGLFGNFIGIIADGFETAYNQRQQSQKEMKRIIFYCQDCNIRIKHFYWMDLDAFK